MPAKKPGIKAAKPKNLFTKPLKFDFKELFKSLANGAIHATATKWDELAKDSVNALSAIGLAAAPDELAFLLVQRAAIKAIFDLAKDSSGLLTDEPTANIADLTAQLATYVSGEEFHLARKFL